MKLEDMARAQCVLDLMHKGHVREESETLADRYWPVIAAEILKDGYCLSGEWPFSGEQIAILSEEYAKIMAS